MARQNRRFELSEINSKYMGITYIVKACTVCHKQFAVRRSTKFHKYKEYQTCSPECSLKRGHPNKIQESRSRSRSHAQLVDPVITEKSETSTITSFFGDFKERVLQCCNGLNLFKARDIRKRFGTWTRSDIIFIKKALDALCNEGTLEHGTDKNTYRVKKNECA